MTTGVRTKLGNGIVTGCLFVTNYQVIFISQDFRTKVPLSSSSHFAPRRLSDFLTLIFCCMSLGVSDFHDFVFGEDGAQEKIC